MTLEEILESLQYFEQQSKVKEPAIFKIELYSDGSGFLQRNSVDVADFHSAHELQQVLRGDH